MSPIAGASLRIGLLVGAVALAPGCATRASLAVRSQPEGAFITEQGTGKSYGTAPVIISYDAASLAPYKGGDGCYRVKGFVARWVSGATSALSIIRLCGSSSGRYQIVFQRNPDLPGLDKDLRFAVRIQALRAQQQQAQAARDSAAAALFFAASGPQSKQVNCTSTQFGDTVRTNCH